MIFVLYCLLISSIRLCLFFIILDDFSEFYCFYNLNHGESVMYVTSYYVCIEFQLRVIFSINC